MSGKFDCHHCGAHQPELERMAKMNAEILAALKRISSAMEDFDVLLLHEMHDINEIVDA